LRGGRDGARRRRCWRSGPGSCWPAPGATNTHDYVRHGTTSLFAALDLASGSVIAQHYRRHRHQEFLRFLKLIDAAVPDGLDLHPACGSYGTHKTPAAKNWLLRHPRFCLHFTPTSASWINLVERWFAGLASRKLRRSAYRSVIELEAGIREWISEWNKNPRPFVRQVVAAGQDDPARRGTEAGEQLLVEGRRDPADQQLAAAAADRRHQLRYLGRQMIGTTHRAPAEIS